MRHLDLLIQAEGAFDADAHRTMPSLLKLMRRGVSHPAARGLSEAICRSLGIQKQLDWPIAALSAQTDALNRDICHADAYWLRLDPIHLDVGMRGMFARSMALSNEESSEFNEVLAALLAPLLSEHERGFGLNFCAGRQGAYVRLQSAPNLCTTPLDEVDGRQPTAFLPSGADAKTWLWLLNEVQIGLHTHPLNDLRATRGHPPINGLWIWGGGVMQTVSSAIKAVYCNDVPAWLHHTADACGLAIHDSPRDLNTLIKSSASSPVMAVIDASEATPSILEKNWFSPLLGALCWGQLGSVTLTLLHDDAQSVTLKPQQAWRIWK